MNILLVSPVLVPFITGIVMLLFWSRRDIQRLLNVIGAALLLAASLALLTAWRVMASRRHSWATGPRRSAFRLSPISSAPSWS